MLGLLDFCDRYLAAQGQREGPIPSRRREARAGRHRTGSSGLLAELHGHPVKPELHRALRERIVERQRRPVGKSPSVRAGRRVAGRPPRRAPPDAVRHAGGPVRASLGADVPELPGAQAGGRQPRQAAAPVSLRDLRDLLRGRFRPGRRVALLGPSRRCGPPPISSTASAGPCGCLTSRRSSTCVRARSEAWRSPPPSRSSYEPLVRPKHSE